MPVFMLGEQLAWLWLIIIVSLLLLLLSLYKCTLQDMTDGGVWDSIAQW